MATVTFAQALSKYRIAIAPVLRRRGSTSWLAGLRVVNGDGLTNIIDPNRKVEGRATPEDALRDLLVLIGSEDVLVGDDEPMEHTIPDEPKPVQIPDPAAIQTNIGDGIIYEKDGKFVLRTPDGKTFFSARRRDLVRKAKLLGVAA